MISPRQKEAIIRKIGKSEDNNLPYHPKEMRPLIPTIHLLIDRFSVEDASRVMDAVYTVYALDRDPKPFSENWENERQSCYKILKEVMGKHMNSQLCEICKVGEDAMKFDSRRVCQDCINNMK